jgi:nucleotide-binding universal stress UspA family protein
MPIRVTVAYDGSPGAAAAIQACVTLFAGAHITVTSVPYVLPTAPGTTLRSVPTISPEALAQAFEELDAQTSEAAQKVATEGAERAAAAGLDAEPAVPRPATPVWTGLLSAAHAARADVLVTGTRGRGGLARALLGSTSTSLLHHADLPLLVVPSGSAEGPTVIAFDGSEAASAAIAAAGRLLPGRPAVVVHAWESPYQHTLTGRALSHGPPAMREIVAGLHETLGQAAEEVTERGVELARFAGLDARGETVDSGEAIWRAVSQAADDQSAAVIVTGARGLGGARSALLGSVSSGLIHNAERPVLVVPGG